MESVDIGQVLDSRLEATIEELREKSEMEIAQYKLEVEAAYKDRVTHTLVNSHVNDVIMMSFIYDIILYQIATLESQSEKDVSTLSRISMDLRKVTSSLGDSNSEIARLQKAVSIGG